MVVAITYIICHSVTGYTTMHRQTSVNAHLKSGQLLLFVFAWHHMTKDEKTMQSLSCNQDRRQDNVTSRAWEKGTYLGKQCLCGHDPPGKSTVTEGNQHVIHNNLCQVHANTTASQWVNRACGTSVGLMLGQRRARWANFETPLVESFELTGLKLYRQRHTHIHTVRFLLNFCHYYWQR